MSELISVVIPIYNVAPYLHKCLDSVLVQRCDEMEIILIDDGSTDQSGVICDDYAIRDSRVRVIHQQNAGSGEARNAGIKAAQGEYLTFLDSDDWWGPDYVPAMLSAMDDADIAVCDLVFVDTDEKLDLKKIYEYCVNYSRGAGLLIEEYMEGPEVSVEAFSVNGEAHIITITDKIVTDLPFFVELGHTEPSRLSKEQQDDIHRVALGAIKAIGMVNGPTHTEIKVTESGAKLVEIAARLGGDFITSRLVPLSTGVDMIDCSYDALFGKSVRYKSDLDRGAAIRFIQGTEGKLVSISGLDQVKSMDNVVEFEIYKSIGDYIRKPENSSDRIGHIIAVGKDANEADRIANEALSKIKIETVI